jgi:NAD(P)-dependent dehydrogenase (short-subunit alcohol dehydrogenase family)
MTAGTIIISGASQGLGAATARIAGQMGANVVLMARSADGLQMVARDVQALGAQALPVVGDVTQIADCQQVVARAVEQFGQIDALVNNAGAIEPIAPLSDADPEAWEHNLAVNLLGPVMLTQMALPHLRQRNGRVINISSGAAVKVIPGWAAYCSAKAALNHFTRMLAVEEPGVTAIAFRPGIVDTAMQRTIRREGAKGMPKDDHARFVRFYEEGELLPPEVPACSVAVLAFHAPHEWSGSFVGPSEERVQSLVRQFGCLPGS